MFVDFMSLSWTAAIILLAAVLTALTVIYRIIIAPVLKAAKVINQRWDDTGDIAEIKIDVNNIMEAIKPTNGDDRSLSARVDAINHAALEAKAVATQTQETFEEYKREELIERRTRIRDTVEEKRALNRRMEGLEGRQNDMASRQTRMENQLTDILKVLEGEHA